MMDAWLYCLVLLVAGVAAGYASVPLERALFSSGKDPSLAGRKRGLADLALRAGILGLAVGIGWLLQGLADRQAPDWSLLYGPSPVLSAGIGLALGLALASILILYRIAFAGLSTEAQRDAARRFAGIPLCVRLTAGIFAGGVWEELIFRWFLLSAVTLLLGWLTGNPAAEADSTAFRLANAAVALVFGLGHLPMQSAQAPLTRFSAVSVVGLISLAGYLFGECFWRWGIESAMLAHASANSVVMLTERSVLRITARGGSGTTACPWRDPTAFWR